MLTREKGFFGTLRFELLDGEYRKFEKYGCLQANVSTQSVTVFD